MSKVKPVRRLAQREVEEIHRTRRRISPFELTQEDLNLQRDTWAGRIGPEGQAEAEVLAIARPDGTTTGVVGPPQEWSPSDGVPLATSRLVG